MASCSKKSEIAISTETFNQLSEAANFLTLVVDEEQELKETCGLTKENALKMMQALHPRIDSQIIKLKDKNLKISIETCRTMCLCAAYSDLTTNENIKKSYLNEFAITTKIEKVNCATKSAQWLCSSDIFKDLKKESQEISTGL